MLASVFDRQSFAGCQRAHAFERRARRGRAPERDRFVDAAHVEPSLDSRVTQKRFDLRCEREFVAGDRDVQRTDAESVACEKEMSLRAIPHRERELSVQSIEERRAALLVEMDQELPVRSAGELVAVRLELGAELAPIEDLAVEDRAHGAVLVPERLLAVIEV